MIYAVKTADGHWTGAQYTSLTPQVQAHHAGFNEVIEPVSSLTRSGDGSWTATPATPAQIAATLTVSRFQARAALLQAGKLDAVTAAVETSDSAFVKLAWNEAVEFPRQSPAIAALAAAIGLSDADVDDLFIAASKISA